MKREKAYKVAGVVQYIPQSEADKFGYVADFQEHPILIYSENGDLEKDTQFFGKVENGFTSLEDKYFMVPDHLVETTFTIEEAREEFPELFL